jgi:hypothetical protein
MGSHDCPGTSSQLAYRRHIDRISQRSPRRGAPERRRRRISRGPARLARVIASDGRQSGRGPAADVRPARHPQAAGTGAVDLTNRRPALNKKPPADARDWAKSAVDKLPKTQKEHYEGIAWGRLDFPDTVVPVAGQTKEALDWWRKQPSVSEVADPKGNYFKGDNQAEAEKLLNALARATSGKGERRVNRGPVAVLKENAFKLAKDDFDTFFVGQARLREI